MISLSNIMDHLAGRLVAANWKNVYAFPTSPIQTPGIVIGYPTDITFDMTFQDGGDEFTIPVFFIVGKNLTEQARDSLSDMIAGATGIKRTLEDNPMTGTTVHVKDCKIETIDVAGISYLSATFQTQVITQNGA